MSEPVNVNYWPPKADSPLVRQPVEPVYFQFALHQRVLIRDPKIEATIGTQINTPRGSMYEVVFWTAQGQRIIVTVFEHELRAKD